VQYSTVQYRGERERGWSLLPFVLKVDQSSRTSPLTRERLFHSDYCIASLPLFCNFNLTSQRHSLLETNPLDSFIGLWAPSFGCRIYFVYILAGRLISPECQRFKTSHSIQIKNPAETSKPIGQLDVATLQVDLSCSRHEPRPAPPVASNPLLLESRRRSFVATNRRA